MCVCVSCGSILLPAGLSHYWVLIESGVRKAVDIQLSHDHLTCVQLVKGAEGGVKGVGWMKKEFADKANKQYHSTEHYTRKASLSVIYHFSKLFTHIIHVALFYNLNPNKMEAGVGNQTYGSSFCIYKCAMCISFAKMGKCVTVTCLFFQCGTWVLCFELSETEKYIWLYNDYYAIINNINYFFVACKARAELCKRYSTSNHPTIPPRSHLHVLFTCTSFRFTEAFQTSNTISVPVMVLVLSGFWFV